MHQHFIRRLGALVIFQDPWAEDCWQENPREEESGIVLGRKSQALAPGNAIQEPRDALLSLGQEGPIGLLDLVHVGEGEWSIYDWPQLTVVAAQQNQKFPG